MVSLKWYRSRRAFILANRERLVRDSGGCYYHCVSSAPEASWGEEALAAAEASGLWLEDSVRSPLWSEGALGQQAGALGPRLASTLCFWQCSSGSSSTGCKPSSPSLFRRCSVGDENDQGRVLDQLPKARTEARRRWMLWAERGGGELYPRMSHLDWGEGKGGLSQVMGSVLPGSRVEKDPEAKPGLCWAESFLETIL